MRRQRQTDESTSGGLVLLAAIVLVHVVGNIFCSSTNTEVPNSKEVYQRCKAELTAFHKITLGFPISVNTEGIEGLSAVPGIGPKLAVWIVREREIRGGFQRLEEIKTIRGIGPALYEKVRPFLTL